MIAAVSDPESADDILGDINNLMEKCQVIQQSAPGGQELSDEEEDIMDLPEDAEEVLASIQGLMAKCAAVQQTARDMQDETFWKVKMESQQQTEDSSEGADTSME